MDTNFDIIIEKSALKQIESYDKYFSLYVEDEKLEFNLIRYVCGEPSFRVKRRFPAPL